MWDEVSYPEREGGSEEREGGREEEGGRQPWREGGEGRGGEVVSSLTCLSSDGC